MQMNLTLSVCTEAPSSRKSARRFLLVWRIDRAIDRNIPELPPDVRNQILIQSKAFDASIFLSQVHPAATKDDLAYGRDRLNENIESRSAALHRLVEDNLDRFVGVKQATHTVYEEMKSGPLSEKGDYAVRDLRESLKRKLCWKSHLNARLKG